MAIEDLLRAIPPPAQPTEPGDPARWAQLQERLGTRLPRDYGDFGMLYGTGEFDVAAGLWVWNPFSASFLPRLTAECRRLREERGLLGRRGVPYGVFPDRPGWLPFGGDIHGNHLCWVTEGEPDDWPILLIHKSRRSFQQVRLPLASFLAQLSDGRLTTIFYGPVEDTEVPAVSFVPDEPRRLAEADRESEGCAAALAADRLGQGVVPPQLEWLGPDHLGRPTGVRAVLGPGFESGPKEVFTTYPDWWGQLPSGQRWARHQLLGWRLGGPGKEAQHNLVPLSQDAHYWMGVTESELASQMGKDCLIYTVQAVYQAQNRYPSDVILQAVPYPGKGSGYRLGPKVIHNYP